MTLLFVAFFAGALTIAAPCVLPLLPVIVGGTVARDERATWYRPLIIVASLAGSIVLFTLLLKASTQLLGVPAVVWQAVSASILMLFGVNLLFPVLWERLAARAYARSSVVLGSSYAKKGVAGDIAVGAALGPVFSSCSPTYALIVAAVLPVSFARGLVYLVAYAIGLASMLLLISYAGQAAVRKLGWLANPHGWFRKTVGVLFILVGLFVLFGLDKTIQTFVLEHGWYAPIERLEQSIRH